MSDQAKFDAQMIREAVRKNETWWVNHYLGRMPWSALISPGEPTSELVWLLADDTRSDAGRNEEALLAIIDCALRDGRLDVFKSYYPSGISLEMPCMQLVQAGFQRVMLRYLEAGFDPTVKSKNGKTTLELADQANQTEMSDFLRSFVARKAIQAALDQSPSSPSPASARAPV